MDEVTWPPRNDPASWLVMRFLDRIAPGWRSSPWQDFTADQVMAFLWTLAPLFKGWGEPGAIPLGEMALDAVLERAADGDDFDPASLNPEALSVLHARLMVALAGAAMAAQQEGPVMRLPQGLTIEQQLRAVLLRLLYGAPLSIEGLD